MSCGVGHIWGSDLVLRWLWCRPAAAAPIGPLAWEPPYAVDAALKGLKKKKNKEKRKNKSRSTKTPSLPCFPCSATGFLCANSTDGSTNPLPHPHTSSCKEELPVTPPCFSAASTQPWKAQSHTCMHVSPSHSHFGSQFLHF